MPGGPAQCGTWRMSNRRKRQRMKGQRPDRCECLVPAFSKTEWGTSGDGMIDAWCVNHEPPRFYGQIPMDDWPWADYVTEILKDTGGVESRSDD